MKEKLDLIKTTVHCVSYIQSGIGPIKDTAIIVGYYASKEVALKKAKGRADWGVDAEVEEIEVFTDGKSLYTVSKL